ncbi:DNA repair protein RAD51 homolog 4 isoform X2 [Mauremys mutica]|uniref:DNA repair protein RAD51 homolog 4 isoform X2 n=1 Tax=Mauremys mutica TaxID=74926 RepID=UPI001D16E6A3|nr:DNA repair protein RAD51 homolog 4 isoform X2 [Mauremys mutica]
MKRAVRSAAKGVGLRGAQPSHIQILAPSLQGLSQGHGDTPSRPLPRPHGRDDPASESQRHRDSLDRLLDSGLYTGEVTELTGAPGSGKTQVCLSIAVSTSHDLKQNVLYVDSTGGFTASRLLQLAQTRTGDEEEQVEALQKIQVARVFDVYKMLDVLQELRCSVSQQVLSSSGPVKVLVVDSVSAVICPLLGGRQAEGLALMMQLARELKTLARELSMAVVVTNHVTRDGSSGHLKPALGRSWSFVPSTRVLLESREGTWGKASTRRIASLTKSSRQPTGIEVELDIGSCGVLEESPAASGEGR